MDQGVLSEALYRLQHRHSDGSWETLVPSPAHHDPAAHDPEKSWAEGDVYVCPSCDEQVRVHRPVSGGVHDGEG